MRNNRDVGAQGVEVDVVGGQAVVPDVPLRQDAPQQSQSERALYVSQYPKRIHRGADDFDLATTSPTNCFDEKQVSEKGRMSHQAELISPIPTRSPEDTSKEIS